MSDTIEITLKLPREFVEDAADFNLLNPDEIYTVLRGELDRRVMAMVNAEIKAYRAEQRDNPDNQKRHA